MRSCPPEGIAIAVEEFDRDGVVYEKNGLSVIAFEVDHGDAIKPAYGYRIEYGGRVGRDLRGHALQRKCRQIRRWRRPAHP